MARHAHRQNRRCNMVRHIVIGGFRTNAHKHHGSSLGYQTHSYRRINQCMRLRVRTLPLVERALQAVALLCRGCQRGADFDQLRVKCLV